MVSACPELQGQLHEASAQSSVTLSGIIDSGLAYTNNIGGHSSWSETSGQLGPSRITFTGSEDLGAGTHSIFRLIDPFLIQNGRAFNVAYVGLSNNRYGTLTLGRQWDTTIDTTSGFASNEMWAGYLGSHIGDADNTQASFKTSNAVKYSSPDIAGLRVGATYAFSNQASTSDGASGFTNNRLISAGAAYANGPFVAGLGFLQADQPDAQPAGALGSPGPGVADDYANIFTVSSTSRAGVERQRIWLAGSSYRIAALLIGGLYSKVQYRYLDATDLTLDNYEANLTWKVTPAWLVGLAYIRTDGRYSGTGTKDAKPGWDQINLGTQYLLSKRTALYLLGVVQQGRHAQAQIYRAGTSTTDRQLVVTAGIQHKF